MFRRLVAAGLVLGTTVALGMTIWLTTRPHKDCLRDNGADASAASRHASLQPEPSVQEPAFEFPPGIRINFVDVTKSSGINFQHFDGRSTMQYIMDQTGSGLGWIDYDQDGLLDLFLVQGSTFLPPHPRDPPTCKLFKNLGGGKFRDVTAEAGLGHVGCGQGVAVGDID